MTVEEMLDREEIRLLLATYNSNGDRGRLEGLAGVFAEDGVLEGGSGFRAAGHEAIVTTLSSPRGPEDRRHRRPAFMRHHLTTSLITFEDADTANGRSYYLVVTDLGPDHSGVYTDLFKRIDGRWRIAHRRSRIDWAADGSHVRATRQAG